MDDPVTVCITNGIRDLADQIEADVEGESRSPLPKEMVQPDLVGFPSKEDGGAEFVFLKIERTENAGVIEGLQNLELLKGASPN
jgi:hypothetical protein